MAHAAFGSYCHTLDIPMRRLNECGITPISPTSLPLFRAASAGRPGLAPLEVLLAETERQGHFVIHYGL